MQRRMVDWIFTEHVKIKTLLNIILLHTCVCGHGVGDLAVCVALHKIAILLPGANNFHFWVRPDQKTRSD